MLSIHLQEKFLAYAQETGRYIAEQLIRIDDRQVTWKTINQNENFWEVNDSLAYGVSGILRFFLELYSFTGDPCYFPMIEQGANWLTDYNRKNKLSYGLLDGRLGVALTLSRAAKELQRPEYQSKAVEIAAGSVAYTQQYTTGHTLGEGRCGMIWALSQLWQSTGEDCLKEELMAQLRILINEVKMSGAGCYWEQRHGLFTGNTGIALTLMRLSVTLDHPTLRFLAEQCLEHELEGAGRLRSLLYANEKAERFSLDHGLTGLMLFYQEAYDFTGDEGHLSAAQELLTYLIRNYPHPKKPKTFQPISVHSGITGIALVICEFLKRTPQPEASGWLTDCCAQLVDRLEKSDFRALMKAGEVQPFFCHDLSLSRGRTGLAFVLLQLLKLDRYKAGAQLTDAPAELIANVPTGGNVLPESGEVLQRLLHLTFPRSLQRMARLPSISTPSAGVALFEHLAASMDRQGLGASGLLQYEKDRFKAYHKLMRLEKMRGGASQTVNVAAIPESDNQLLSMKLELSPHISIHQINDPAPIPVAQEVSYIILRTQFLRLEEIEMDEEAVSFLRLFKPAQRVGQAIQRYKISCNDDRTEHGECVDFIREALRLQLLTPVKTMTQ